MKFQLACISLQLLVIIIILLLKNNCKDGEQTQDSMTWVVGDNGEKIAFKDMPVDMAVKILNTMGGE